MGGLLVFAAFGGFYLFAGLIAVVGIGKGGRSSTGWFIASAVVLVAAAALQFVANGVFEGMAGALTG